MYGILTLTDYLSVGWFLAAWIGFELIIDRSPLRKRTLSYLMDDYRRSWMHAMANRPVRIMDTAIMAGLQQGTAFFASTALLAIGGGFALLNATDRILEVARDLSLPMDISRAAWEIKVLGLMAIFAYAFFKFGWSYRLFNYASIIMGAVPETGTADRKTILDISGKAADLNVIAGRHFNRGQRALFFSIGFLGWFAGPEVFAATTFAVLAVLLRRQFASRARTSALSGHQLALSIAASEGEYTETGSSNPFT